MNIEVIHRAIALHLKEMKCLGLLIEDRLCWKAQINKVIKKYKINRCLIKSEEPDFLEDRIKHLQRIHQPTSHVLN